MIKTPGTEYVMKKRFSVAEMLIFLGAFILLSILPGTVCGLHFDEAWIFLRVKEISAGAHPVNGTNGYTGALHQYLLLPVFGLFGYRVEALRIFCAFLNSLCVLFVMLLVRRLHPGRNHHLLAGLLLATFPVFITQARFCVELTAINPLFTFAALYFFARALQSGRAAPAAVFALAGGACLGLAAYDHILGLTLAVAFACAAFAFYRRELIGKRRVVGCAVAGFLAGFAPRIAVTLRDSAARTAGDQGHFGLFNFLVDVPHVPGIFCGIWDGWAVFRRMTGQNLIPVIPYVSVCLIVLVAINVFWLKSRLSRLDRAMLFGASLYVAAIVVVAPALAIQYFELPFLFLPYLLVRLIVPLAESSSADLIRVARIVVALVLILNVLYLSVNYFACFLETGGKTAVFGLGRRVIDTSNHFIDTKKLYREIIACNIRVVATQLPIAAPLCVYDLPQRRLRFVVIATQAPPSDSLDTGKRTALIFYNGPTPSLNPVWLRSTGVIDPPNTDTIVSGGVVYRIDKSFDRHFRVYIAGPGQDSAAMGHLAGYDRIRLLRQAAELGLKPFSYNPNPGQTGNVYF